MTCEHTRYISLNAKADDRQFTSVPHLDLEKDGYAPHIRHLCGGDYITLRVCLDCGTVVGFTPMSDEEITEAMNE